MLTPCGVGWAGKKTSSRAWWRDAGFLRDGKQCEAETPGLRITDYATCSDSVLLQQREQASLPHAAAGGGEAQAGTDCRCGHTPEVMPDCRVEEAI